MKMEQKDFLNELQDAIGSTGISRGDRVYVASDVTGFLFRGVRLCGVRTKEGQDALLKGLLDLLKALTGPEGTILIPMYSWDFCRGIPFDIRSTPSQVGSLGNFALKEDPDFVRTAHPIYSFLVTGQDRELLTAMDNRDSWGKDSPFGWLHANHGKMLLFDVNSSECNTFEHYVEQCIGVPWRYHKAFRGGYTDCEGVHTERTCRMYVRDLSIVMESVPENDTMYLQRGLMREADYQGIRLKSLLLSESFPVVADALLNHNAENIYRFSGYTADWTIPQTHPDDLQAEGGKRD